MRRWVAIGAILLGALSTAEALEVRDVQLQTGVDGDSVIVVLDAPAKFRVYPLDGPPRVVVVVPEAVPAAGLAELPGAGIVQQVRVRRDDLGARIEIGLATKAEVRARRDGAQLVIRLRPKGKKAQQAAKAPAKQPAAKGLVKSLDVREGEGFSELVLGGEGLDLNHDVFLSKDGRKLILDLWGAKSLLPKEHFSFPAQHIATVDVGEAKDRLRLVVTLPSTAKPSYRVEAAANRLVLRIGRMQAPQRVASLRAGWRVEEVAFRPEDRIARIVVRTNRPDPVVDLKRKGDLVILDLRRAQLAPGQQRSLDVSSFPGPVKQVDVYQRGEDVRIVARLRERAEVNSFQSGNALTLNLVPADLAAARRGEEEASPYRGQKVSFNFRDIDIRQALALIAEMSDLNIIMSDDVQGKLTMRLENVPWDQALDLILAAKGLGKEKIGNVLRIAPLEVIRADAEARRKAQLSSEEAEPLYTEFIELSYASVNDVKTILEGGSIQGGGEKVTTEQGKGGASRTTMEKGGLKLLSKRGSILLDERSNTLIITDTRERLDNIKRLIARIDRPLQQVLIESRIVEASDSFSRELGVRWGGTYNARSAARFPATTTVTGVASPGFVVDLPAAVGPGSGGAIGIQLGSLVPGRLNLNLELSAAESEGKAKVISTPRVLTSNLQEAIIEQDIQIPYATVTFTGGSATTSTKLQSAKLTLKVKPQITADRRIILDLTVNKDTPKANYLVKGGNPIIEKKMVKTRLMVNDGETVVLGGIYSRATEQTEGGVPLLRRIPLIGWLFKNKKVSDQRNELLVFLTPRIVEDRTAAESLREMVERHR